MSGSVNDRPGRPSTSSIDENIKAVKELILNHDYVGISLSLGHRSGDVGNI